MSQKAVEDYVVSVEGKFKTGQAREHAYRPAFEALIQALDPKLKILNDPSRSEHGNPDFVFLRDDITVGYTETKDVDADLEKIEKSEQMERYLGYSNLILTDYLEFRFFRNGSRYGEPIRIGAVAGGKIVPNESAYEELVDALADFLTGTPERIKSGKRLAEIMGGKGRRIRDNVRHYLAKESDKNKELLSLYEAIRTQLVHDITPETFSDMYAQTLVYGLFAARYEDDSPETFSRREAGELIPASNPFLKSFFDHIAGVNFDTRLGYIVDELCEVFRVSTVKELIDEYYEGTTVEAKDQIIHFYEDFLKEYDAALRKKMGAYYTPLPVVRFIVRAVDDILKKNFGLAEGLADTSKLANGKTHRVQVLDPAVGTGTFISAVIALIYKRIVSRSQKGSWPAYVHHDLLPRLHGFELMMAPYTIAHLKLSLAFKKTGFKYFNETRAGKSRLQIYLTNSLEQASPHAEMFSLGFGQAIAEEAKQAEVVKNKTPIMVILGNPPYSVSSSNKGEWIQNLIKAYKQGLGEKKINLDDDYIKFIRLAEHFIEKNGSGIVAMITNNSYIDGITHRQMRKHLLETFDDIYILDLHGNSKKKEAGNVFNIQQGVAISILVRKTGDEKGLGRVHHAELVGGRESKFSALEVATTESTAWTNLEYTAPSYFFVPKDFADVAEYDLGFLITELCEKYTSGIETQKDSLVIQFVEDDLERVRKDIESGDKSVVEHKYGVKDSRDWTFEWARKDLANAKNIRILYRPFDERWTFHSGNSKGIVAYPRAEIMDNLLSDNIALLTTKRQTSSNFQHIFATKLPAERCAVSLQTGEVGYVFPLFIYAADGTRVPNLKDEIVLRIEKIVGKTTPEDIFDYVYAVLHSPNYREKYKEFLKIDFPRVPYPKDKKQFATLVALGKELRELHLLESPKVKKYTTSYDIKGSDTVEKITRKGDSVYINAEQYFGGVPEVAWNFYIGGYQPAQKWLKDRKGRTLTNDDIEHYQKIIVALIETGRLMKRIDEILK